MRNERRRPESAEAGDARKNETPRENPETEAGFAPPEIIEGKAKEKLVRDLETNAAKKYDEWAACVTRAELVGQPLDRDECAAYAKETVGQILRLMTMEDPNGVGQALDLAGRQLAKEYRGRLNDPDDPVKTLADVARDHLSGLRAKSLEERRKLKFPGAQTFADIKRLLARDLESLAGVPLSRPELVRARTDERRGKDAEKERRERVDRAADFLANNDYVLERYRQTRNLTLGHGIDESFAPRREFVRELIEDMIPENAYDDDVRELNETVRAGIDALLERAGGDPKERMLWHDLLIDATAEELRLEILKSKPGLKGGGQTAPASVKRVIEGLLRDMGDPAALKKKRKRPWEK